MKITKNKGITLVALVITIIILLILAGISIATLTGSGLFEKARLAKERTEERREQEEQSLGDYENQMLDYISNTRNDNNQSKFKVLFDGDTDVNGPISTAGATDGSSERILADDVNNYNIVLISVGISSDDNVVNSTMTFTNLDFDKTVCYFMSCYSSTFGKNLGNIKIDSENNKIIFLDEGDSLHQINSVVGIKF